MNWKATNEQQDEALWRVFLMFVALALLVIRTGLVSRGVAAILPATTAALYPVPEARDRPPSTPPADLYQATLVLLCLAEAAGHLFILKQRAVWELMNRPPPRPAQCPPRDSASLCGHPAQRLDTS